MTNTDNTDLPPSDRIEVGPFFKVCFDLQKVKRWETRDGEGFSYELLYLGKVVASVRSEGCGGDVEVDWVGTARPVDFIPPRGQLKKLATLDATVQKARTALAAVVKATPPVMGWGSILSMTEGMLLEEVVNFDALRRVCEKKIAVRRPSDGDSQYLVINAPLTPENRFAIFRRYPGSVILNDEVSRILARI